MTVNDRLLSILQAADVLGVHENTVRKMIADGTIPSVVMGRRQGGRVATRRLIAASDLKTYIDQHKEGRTTDGH